MILKKKPGMILQVESLHVPSAVRSPQPDRMWHGGIAFSKLQSFSCDRKAELSFTYVYIYIVIYVCVHHIYIYTKSIVNRIYIHVCMITPIHPYIRHQPWFESNHDDIHDDNRSPNNGGNSGAVMSK